MKSATACLLVLSAFAGVLHPQGAAADPAASITADVVKNYIRTLSADAFEGRGPGTPGAAKARDFIIKELEAAGAKPGPGGFIQKVPLRRVTNTDKKMHVRGKNLDMELEASEHFVMMNGQEAGAHAFSGELVYCGHGVQAPEIGWDDFKGLDVKGKVLLVFVGDPQTEDRSLFGGDAMTYYGRWTYKLEKAKELGALGCLIIHRPDWASYPWLVVQTSWSGPRMETRRESYTDELGFGGWVSYGTAEKLTAQTGINLDRLAEMAAKRDFKPIPLGVTVDVSVKTALENVDDENIVGVFPGKGKTAKDEWIVYSAHYDHLGKNEALKSKDKIFNGALDNASGTAAALSIARAVGAMKGEHERSIMMLIVCSEEQGLLGSKWYSENPLVPVKKTVANVNIDGLNVLEPSKELEVIGSGQNELEARLAKIIAKDGRVVMADSEPSGGYYYRSDHFNFARVGIPALYVKAGLTVAGKPDGYMKAWKDEYRKVHYHQPSDEFHEEWPCTGGAADARALFDLGRELANSTDWPAWNQTSEFRSIREKSMK